MGVGEIPWNHIVAYGRFHELDNELIDVLIIVIRNMDHVYLEQERAKADKKAKKPKNAARNAPPPTLARTKQSR